MVVFQVLFVLSIETAPGSGVLYECFVGGFRASGAIIVVIEMGTMSSPIVNYPTGQSITAAFENFCSTQPTSCEIINTGEITYTGELSLGSTLQESQ